MADDRTRTVECSIDIEASVEQVWTMLTTSDGLSAWLGEGTTIESTVGGVLSTPDVETGIWRSGRVLAVEAHRVLSIEWAPADGRGPVSVVELRLEVEDGGDGRSTRVSVVETLADQDSAHATSTTSGSSTPSEGYVRSDPAERAATWSWRLWSAQLALLDQLALVV